ncbi:hypothetical protein IWW36_001040 [Coemansia brasiliensis]|uniref:Transcription factor TFIIB cyclin-like domain-containing protein n=1 Tax=Coemansia brasiliensis TaxID=2650707 RepID=A0A9W8I9S4_9FUNG|nr:hypothetical protein IWW36_001040 [Coemansia brasiliensis]
METVNTHRTASRMALSNLLNSTSVSPLLQAVDEVEPAQANGSIADMQTCPDTIGGGKCASGLFQPPSSLANHPPVNYYQEYEHAPVSDLDGPRSKHQAEAGIQPDIVYSMPPLMAYSALSKDHSKGYISSTMEPAIYNLGEFDYAAPVLPPPPQMYDESFGSKLFDKHYSPNMAIKHSHISDKAQMPVSPRNFDYEDLDDDEDDDDMEPVAKDRADEMLSGAAYRRAETFGSSLAPPIKAPLDKKRRAATFSGNSPKRLKSQESFAAIQPLQLVVSSPAKPAPRIDVSSPEKPSAAALAEEKKKDAQAKASYPDGKVPLVDWKSLDIPESIWVEAQDLYDQIKTVKAVQNRQPIRMKHAILAALIVSLCREHNYPRTIAQICTASNVSKHEIHLYLRLMKQVLGKRYTLPQRASPSAFIQRWVSVLELPEWVASVSTQVFDRADRMAIVQGKSPPSICATSMWLVIWCYNHRHALYQLGFDLPKDTVINSSCVPCVPGLLPSSPSLSCTQYSVSKNGSVGIPTMSGILKCFIPNLQALVSGLLDEHL